MVPIAAKLRLWKVFTALVERYLLPLRRLAIGLLLNDLLGLRSSSVKVTIFLFNLLSSIDGRSWDLNFWIQSFGLLLDLDSIFLVFLYCIFCRSNRRILGLLSNHCLHLS